MLFQVESNKADLLKLESRLAKHQGRLDHLRPELARRQKRLQLLHARSGKRATFASDEDFTEWLNKETNTVNHQVIFIFLEQATSCLLVLSFWFTLCVRLTTFKFLGFRGVCLRLAGIMVYT